MDPSAPAYWDKLYSETTTNFDWYCQIKDIYTLFSPKVTADSEILIQGCGSSRTPEQLYTHGHKHITAVDFCERVIAAQKHRCQGLDGISFEYMNVCYSELPSDTYDFIIDKALLDTILCSTDNFESCKAYLRETYRVLKPGGTFMILSHADPSERDDVLGLGSLGWDVSHVTVAKDLTCVQGAESGCADKLTSPDAICVLSADEFREVFTQLHLADKDFFHHLSTLILSEFSTRFEHDIVPKIKSSIPFVPQAILTSLSSVLGTQLIKPHQNPPKKSERLYQLRKTLREHVLVLLVLLARFGYSPLTALDDTIRGSKICGIQDNVIDYLKIFRDIIEATGSRSISMSFILPSSPEIHTVLIPTTTRFSWRSPTVLATQSVKEAEKNTKLELLQVLMSLNDSLVKKQGKHVKKRGKGKKSAPKEDEPDKEGTELSSDDVISDLSSSIISLISSSSSKADALENRLYELQIVMGLCKTKQRKKRGQRDKDNKEVSKEESLDEELELEPRERTASQLSKSISLSKFPSLTSLPSGLCFSDGVSPYMSHVLVQTEELVAEMLQQIRMEIGDMGGNSISKCERLKDELLFEMNIRGKRQEDLLQKRLESLETRVREQLSSVQTSAKISTAVDDRKASSLDVSTECSTVQPALEGGLSQEDSQTIQLNRTTIKELAERIGSLEAVEKKVAERRAIRLHNMEVDIKAEKERERARDTEIDAARKSLLKKLTQLSQDKVKSFDSMMKSPDMAKLPEEQYRTVYELMSSMVDRVTSLEALVQIFDSKLGDERSERVDQEERHKVMELRRFEADVQEDEEMQQREELEKRYKEKDAAWKSMIESRLALPDDILKASGWNESGGQSMSAELSSELTELTRRLVSDIIQESVQEKELDFEIGLSEVKAEFEELSGKVSTLGKTLDLETIVELIRSQLSSAMGSVEERIEGRIKDELVSAVSVQVSEDLRPTIDEIVDDRLDSSITEAMTTAISEYVSEYVFEELAKRDEEWEKKFSAMSQGTVHSSVSAEEKKEEEEQKEGGEPSDSDDVGPVQPEK
ncbi:hypothetical protein ADUPG1_011444, partial [Aduncisulcus paluster]